MAENSPFHKRGKVDLEPLAGNEAVAGLLESWNIKGTRTTTLPFQSKHFRGFNKRNWTKAIKAMAP